MKKVSTLPTPCHTISQLEPLICKDTPIVIRRKIIGDISRVEEYFPVECESKVFIG